MPGKYEASEPQEFQFHKGTIRTSHSVCRVNAYLDFNSIKVRLEPTSVAKTICSTAISIP